MKKMVVNYGGLRIEKKGESHTGEVRIRTGEIIPKDDERNYLVSKSKSGHRLAL